MSKGGILDKDIFYKSITTLKDASKDNRNKFISAYMTSSQIEIFDFDKVKSLYCGSLNSAPSEQPRSVDALLLLKDGRSVLIEFKNGKIDARKSHEIHQKVLDTLLILFDLTGLNLTDTRKYFDFILVYNEQANEKGHNENASKSNSVQSSNSRYAILNKISNKGKKKSTRFNLGKLEHYCFRSVYTCTEREFETDHIQTWHNNTVRFLNVDSIGYI